MASFEKPQFLIPGIGRAWEPPWPGMILRVPLQWGHRNHPPIWMMNFRYVKAVFFGSALQLGGFSGKFAAWVGIKYFMKLKGIMLSIPSFDNMVELQDLWLFKLRMPILKDLKERKFAMAKEADRSPVWKAHLRHASLWLMIQKFHFTIQNQPRSYTSIWGSHHRSPEENSINQSLWMRWCVREKP